MFFGFVLKHLPGAMQRSPSHVFGARMITGRVCSAPPRYPGPVGVFTTSACTNTTNRPVVAGSTRWSEHAATRRRLKITAFLSVPPQIPRASLVASATRNHGGDYRGVVRDRGHPQGGPHQPQDRGGEDRHTTALCNDARATQI